MPRIESQKTRQMLLVAGDRLSPGELPEKLELFDKDGNPADEAKLQTCYPCHTAIKDQDFVFTRYAP